MILGLAIGLFISVPFCFIGVWYLKESLKKKKLCTIKTEGVIISISKKSGKDSEGDRVDLFSYLYEYYVEKGKYNDWSNSSQTYPTIGDKVELMYNPQKPSQNYLCHEMSSYRIFAGYFAILLGGGFSVFLLYQLIRVLLNIIMD